MQRHFFRKLIIIGIFLFPVSFINSFYVYAASLKDDAEAYRTKGYEAQERGNIDTAITWYTKAVKLDPDYAVAHNDLGILYEAKGWLDKAESEYQRALAIDDNYGKAHTNLALLYERKGELEKAAFHWMKRYKLGKPGDPWTKEAKKRLVKLGLIEENQTPKQSSLKEQEQEKVAKKGQEETKKLQKTKKPPPKINKKKERKKSLKRLRRDLKDEWTKIGSRSVKRKAKKIAKRPYKRTRRPSRGRKNNRLEKKIQESLALAEKRLREEKSGNKKSRPLPHNEKETSKRGARRYYLKADNYYKKGEYSRGLDLIRTAKKEYPQDRNLLNLEDSIKYKMKEERIEDYYNEGILLYHQKDFPGARKEFKAILNILPE